MQDGTVERIEPGARVYRLTGSPPDPGLDPLRAAWLQLGAATPTAQWLRVPDAMVSHRSAAAVLGLGDLLADTHEFYTRTRHRLRRDDLRIRVRAPLARQDWTIVRGLPVTIARKIIADLLHDREDESAVARIVQNALRAELLTPAELDDSVRGHAATYSAQSDSLWRHPRRGRQWLEDRVSGVKISNAGGDPGGSARSELEATGTALP